MTAYLPFDGSLEMRHAVGVRGARSEGAAFTEGRAGQAVVPTTGGVEVPGAGNFSRPRGSLAFWVRPDWSPDDPADTGDRSLFGLDNFVLNFHRPKRVFFFMTGKTTQTEGYKWDYGTADTKFVPFWKPGEWHHVAATWDAATGKKALYIDGKPVSEHVTEWIRSDPFRTAGFITLGGKRAPGVYDELMLWDRPISAAEVALLAGQPAEVARELKTGLPVAAEKGPDWPVAFDLYVVKPDDMAMAIVEPGATFTAKIPARNPGVARWSGRLTFTLLDFWEKPRDSREIELTLVPGEARTLDVPFAAPERGIFKVAVRLRQGERTFERDVASFAAWPKPAGPPNPDSFFGHHVNSWSEGTVAQAARLGIGWNRDHNMLQYTWWPRVQPEPDTWNDDYSGHRERMRRYGFRVLGQFFGTPYWAAADKPLAPPKPNSYPSPAPPKLEALRAYVSEAVKRFPEVRHWEVWNEPEVSIFWTGTPEQFAELCRTAYEAAKAADPKVTVMNGGYTQSGFAWHEAAAKAGSLKYADAVSLHFYHGATQTPEELEKRVTDQVTHWKTLAREYAGRELPIWDTESGSSDTTWLRGFESPDLPPPSLRTPMNWRAATISSVQMSALLQRAGVVRSFQYLWQPSKPGEYESLQTIDMTNAPRPKLMARVAMAEQVDGARYVDFVRRDEGRFQANVYQKGATTVVMGWTGRGGRVRLSGPWPGRIESAVDIMGNARPAPAAVEFGEEPSYLHIAAPAEAVAKALRGAKVTVLTAPEPVAKESGD